MSAVRVEGTGPSVTVQDLGRPGFAHIGVGWSGAADRGSLALANRLVGNREDAAAFEVVHGGLRLRVEDGPVWMAVTGAAVSVLAAGRQHATGQAFYVPAGGPVTLGPATAGLRSYVAVRGGLLAGRTLGSASTDVLSGVGPGPVQAGQVFGVGDAVVGDPYLDVAPMRPLPVSPVDLGVVLGPRDEWLTPDSRRVFLTATWRVTAEANRVGLRLEGPQLHGHHTRELDSEGTVPGAIQVPRSGQPILFLADAPVTGGYPVVAVATAEARDLAAQLRPGDEIRWRFVASPLGRR